MGSYMADGDPGLIAIAERVFPRYGFTPLEADYVAMKDLSFKWSFRKKELRLFISDYLKGAPDHVIEDFVCGALHFIKTKERSFDGAFAQYARTDEFVLRIRPIYMSRMRSITHDGQGNERSLYDSVQRLMDAGLVFPSDIDNTVFVWTKRPTYTRLGYCATIVRLIVISCIFDDLNVDDRIVDYVVYHEIVHNRIGYRPFDRNPHDAQFKRYEKMYPDTEGINEELRQMTASRPAENRRVSRHGRKRR